jgi:hypothetical protein
VAVLNRLMGSQPSSLDYWISNDNALKKSKIAHIRFLKVVLIADNI